MAAFSYGSNGYAILVVDDEAMVARQLVDGLTLSGFRVHGVASSAEALAVLAADPTVAAVITDIRMPGLDGLGLAQHVIQQREEEHAVEVVVMTGHATIDDAAAAVRTRVCDFLRKPFRLAEAVNAVALALERAGSRRRSALERSSRLTQLRHLESASNARIDDRRGGAVMNPPSDRDITAISHALRTPLVAIAGGAELLGGPSGADTSGEFLTMLLNGVRQARQAVELVEELHNAGSSAAPASRSAFSLDVLLERAVQRLRPLAECRDSTLESLPSPPVTLMANRPQIERAIDHCVIEALDWAKPGSSIRTSLRLHHATGSAWAVVTVLVTPAGATVEHGPSSDIDFPETNSLWSRTQEGLRFAIARRLVEAHEGRITSWNGSEGMMALRIALPL